MNKQIADSDLSNVIQVESPGQQLAVAREKMGLSQKQVADNLRLRLQSIIAIENDELEEGISPTFSKGYMRLYAKLVNLDVEPLLDAFNTIHNTDEMPSSLKMQSFSRRVEREANDSRWNLVTYVVIFFVLASLGYWWYDNHGKESIDFLSDQPTSFEDANVIDLQSNDNSVNDNSVNDNSANDNLPDQSEGIAVEDSAGVNVPNDTGELVVSNASETSSEEASTLQNAEQARDALAAGNENADPSESTTSDAEAQDAITPAISDESISEQNIVEQQIAETQTLAATEGESTEQAIDVASLGDVVDISFTFLEDCWLSVTDATDDAIAYGIKSQGYVMNVKGIPPISVNLCPPERVQIVYNGEPVNLSRFNPENSIVFELPLASN